MFLSYVLDVITIENYRLGIAISLSLLAMIMAIAAYKFRVELLVFIRGKIPYTKM
jgi:hypothetical protein